MWQLCDTYILTIGYMEHVVYLCGLYILYVLYWYVSFITNWWRCSLSIRGFAWIVFTNVQILLTRPNHFRWRCKRIIIILIIIIALLCTKHLFLTRGSMCLFYHISGANIMVLRQSMYLCTVELMKWWCIFIWCIQIIRYIMG